MKIFKSAWRLMFVLLLLFSLTINVAMFVGGTIYKMASSAFGAATGIQTAAAQHADEIADLGSDLANERRVSRELRGEVADISDNLVSERKVTKKLRKDVTGLSGDLATEKAVRRKLSHEIADLSGDLVAERLALKKVRRQLIGAGAVMITYRGKKMVRNQAVELTADSISKRAVKTSSRSVSSMAGEALPYLGTAVIVGVTALELKDLCDTIKDMTELKRSFNPELQHAEDETTVCSMKVPSKEELWETAKASPEMAWAAAKDATPTLEDIQNYEFPNINWTEAWNTTAEGAESVWSATKSGAGAAMDATAETTGGWLIDAKKYWSGEEVQQDDQ